MVIQYHNRFAAIPTEFARDPSITPRAAKVYLYLASLPGGKPPSMAAIGRAIGMSQKTVASAVMDLQESGYLQRDEEVGANG